MPDDWQPTPDELRWAEDARPDIDVRVEAESFRDYWHAKPGKDGCKTDWTATWRNWIRRATTRRVNGSANRQTALETRNRAVADNWLNRQEENHASR